MRSLTLLLSILALCVAPAGARPADDVRSALVRLGDPDGGIRLDAQRWLGIHLARTDFAEVADAARRGSAEARRRLALALASEDRHLGLTVLLLTDRDDQVGALGEAATAEMLARWSSSTRDLPDRQRTVPEPWEERYPSTLALEAATDSLATLVDRLARLAPGPAPIVLDPSLTGAAGERARPGREALLSGTWSALLEDLTRDHRVSFEVFGMREEGEVGVERAAPWVRVCKRGDEGDAPTSAHVIGWCRGLARDHDPAWNTACAQALASLEWPAALALLEERWTVDGEEPALEGLLLAAARGRVAPVLARAGTLRALLGRPLDGPRGADAAQTLARALAQISPFAPDGEALAPVLVEGWDAAGARSRWVRLVALEGMGVRQPAAAARAGEVLVDPRAGAHLRRQAVRALARTRGADDRLSLPARGSSDLFEARAGVATLATDLTAAGVQPPPAAERVWEQLPVIQEARLAYVEWCVGAGTADAERSAATCLSALLDSPALELGGVAGELRRWAAGTLRAPVKRMVTAVRDARPDSALLGEIAFRAGLTEPAERRAFFDAQLALHSADPSDPAPLRRIACAAADPALGPGARDVLLAALAEGAPERALLPAIELASDVLRRARKDDERVDFLAALRRAAGRARHPMAGRFFAREWPPEPELEPVRLERLDRSLAAD